MIASGLSESRGGNGGHVGGHQDDGHNGGSHREGQSAVDPEVPLRSALTSRGNDGSLLSIVIAQRDRFHHKYAGLLPGFSILHGQALKFSLFAVEPPLCRLRWILPLIKPCCVTCN